jgi:hypothetical protein
VLDLTGYSAAPAPSGGGGGGGRDPPLGEMMLSFLSHPLPTVDPEYIKALWPHIPRSRSGYREEGSGGTLLPNADVIAVWARATLIKATQGQGLLNR